MNNKVRKASKFVGKLKVWQGRLTSYISMVNFFMIFYLYITESPLGFEWYYWFLIIIVACAAIIVIDVIFIFPEVMNYTFGKNINMTKMKKHVEKNTEKLDKILTILGD